MFCADQNSYHVDKRELVDLNKTILEEVLGTKLTISTLRKVRLHAILNRCSIW